MGQASHSSFESNPMIYLNLIYSESTMIESKQGSLLEVRKEILRESPGGPVVKASCSYC